jgi:hypothetical protein
MTTTDPINEIMARVERMERMLAQLTQGKKGPAWVRASSIAAMTGWDKEKMRIMRENGVVKTRRIGRRYEYDASSIPSLYIRNPVI